MFNRIPIDQFHQILSTPPSRISPSSSLIPLAPQIPTPTNPNFLSFDPLLIPINHQFQAHDDLEEQDAIVGLDARSHQGTDTPDPWSTDEVVQLLRIKSSSENWFQDLTWDHVSRKLAEMGYRRSAGKCKEKFEEETCRSFSSALMYNKNCSRYLISEELDEEHMYHVDQNGHHHLAVDLPEKVNLAGGGGENGVGGQKGNFGEGTRKVVMVQPPQGNVQVVKQESMKGQRRTFKEELGQVGDFGRGGVENELQGQKDSFGYDPREVTVQLRQGDIQVVKQKTTKDTMGQRCNFEHDQGQRRNFEERGDGGNEVQWPKGNFGYDPREVVVQSTQGNDQVLEQSMINCTKGHKRNFKENQGQKGNYGERVEKEVQGQNGHFGDDPEEVMVQPSRGDVHVLKQEMSKGQKRKKKHEKFETFKELCFDIVNKMMAHQEEMHNKLLDEMASRYEEKIAREEARRSEANERAKEEIHIREHEQTMARERQSTINEYLNKFNYDDQKIQLSLDINYEELLSIMTCTMAEIPKIPFSSKTIVNTDPVMSKIPFSDKTTRIQNPTIPKMSSSDKSVENPHPTISTIPFLDKTFENLNRANDDDIGKRWPKDEVLALINIRCNVCNGIDGSNKKNEGYFDNFKGVGSLWERISRAMLELGYKRSAKRCKEKWENINKYFRKTKEANKKRSSNSRTCPYYQQLSTLYNQGKLATMSHSTELFIDQPNKVSGE